MNCCCSVFVTPWTAAHQVSLSSTISWSFLKFMSIESVILSNHLILCRPLLSLPLPASGECVVTRVLFSSAFSVLPLSSEVGALRPWDVFCSLSLGSRLPGGWAPDGPWWLKASRSAHQGTLTHRVKNSWVKTLFGRTHHCTNKGTQDLFSLTI